MLFHVLNLLYRERKSNKKLCFSITVYMHESNVQIRFVASILCDANFELTKLVKNVSFASVLFLFLLVSLSISTQLVYIWWIKMPWIESEYQMFTSILKQVEEWEIFKIITNYARITFIFYILIWNVVFYFTDLLSFFYCKTEQLQTKHFSMNPAR